MTRRADSAAGYGDKPEPAKPQVPTRIDATLSANEKRFRRNQKTMMENREANRSGKPMKRLENLKPLPRGKGANQPWKRSTTKRVSAK